MCYWHKEKPPCRERTDRSAHVWTTDFSKMFKGNSGVKRWSFQPMLLYEQLSIDMQKQKNKKTNFSDLHHTKKELKMDPGTKCKT